MHRLDRTFIGIIALAYCFYPLLAQSASGETNASPKQLTAEHDGQHDFDFWFGSWKVHNRRLLHPLTGSKTWVEFEGRAIARPVWNGRANMDEYEADSPAGHIEGMTVRTYNAATHQWSIYWSNQKDGTFSLPATVGGFQNGRGEFFDQEDFNGRAIFVRFLWILNSPDSGQWEQAFSTDGGASWETNWIMSFVRE